jgi:protease-4
MALGRVARASLLLAAAASVACEGRPRWASKGDEAHGEGRSGHTIAVLDLSGGVPEHASSGWLGLASRGASMDDLVREVEHLERDRDVAGVLVRLGSARVGVARALEIGAMLASLGAKLPVWCHADDYGNGTMYLAARGCKKVWASPAASVDAIGLAAQTLYFHKLLVEEIGLDVDFLQVGKFKGAEEPFTRDGPSPEARESVESTLADMRATWLDGILKGRPGVAEATPEDGPYSAREAKGRGLVDEVGYFDEARGQLERATGGARAEVRVGPGSPSAGGDPLTDALRSLAGDSLGAAPVALVHASGAISMEGGGVFGDGRGIVARRIVRTIQRLTNDDDVKAVVLRIDSPGGSALASDLIWHDLMRLRAKKPLVVSIGDMAASGGYYLASAGAVVFADETSIVGSIGVVGGKIAADHALERFGVHGETFTGKSGDRASASRAAYESLIVPWDDATRARILETMTGIYDLFLARVSEGRGVPVERVAPSAEGRIFSGRHGMARGLVDEIGGLRAAIARARTMAGLPADAPVGVVTEPGVLLRTLADDESDEDGQSAVRAEAAALWKKDLPPFVVSFVASLAPMGGEEHALCALPFALAVR